MPDYASLEIGLYRFEADHYSVELRYMDSVEEDRSDRGVAHFDKYELRRLSHDAQLYGDKLSDYLFADPQVLKMFERACDLALSKPDEKLRVRLFIDKSARALHDLWWETLTDPRDDFKGSRLSDHRRILFSRYLASKETRPGSDAKRGLRALVVVANPQPHPEKPKLDPIDVAKELARAKKGLAELYRDELVSAAEGPGRVTLNNLIDKLDDGFDIIYLVCHGSLLNDDRGNLLPYLWIDDED